jgi:hypothetical protein
VRRHSRGLQVGAGATFIASNLAVRIAPVVPNPVVSVGFDLDSQAAPVLTAGIGWRSRSGESLGAIDLTFHALFTEPTATNYLSASVGLAF